MTGPSKSDIVEMIESGLAEAEDAIRSHPADTISLYETGAAAFLEGQQFSTEPEMLRDIGITFEQYKLVHRYLLAMAFMSAWYHRQKDKARRDKAAQSAALLASGTGLDPDAAFKTLLEYEGNWKKTMHYHGVASTGTGCLLLLTIPTAASGLVMWAF